jgi:predicted RNase H-like nuclease
MTKQYRSNMTASVHETAKGLRAAGLMNERTMREFDEACLKSETRSVGIDGYRHGWIAVWIDKAGCRGFEILSKIDCIKKFNADMVMIDIPIGPPQHGYRCCDQAARKMLGNSGRSRVFLGVQRPLLNYLDDFNPATLGFVAACEKVNARARLECGRGISRQLFGILPKIKEVDQFMLANNIQQTFRETHPELVFHRLNGGVGLLNKKTPEGKKQRRDLVAAHGFKDIDVWLSELFGSGVRPDDILDACACAIAAESPNRRLECDRESDARGLRMEMWF